MASAFIRVVQIIARYGRRAVDWCYRNRSRIMTWLRNGVTIDTVIRRIREVLGL